ncbi:RAMP superfamily CRISPR-associated protein [Fusobacterium pseudoperiodonticum]
MKEFLKLDNKLNLELKIKPLSPLCIKLSKEEKEGEESKSSTYSTILVTEQGETKANNTGELELDTRKGEIYIPGSTLKGLFRDRFTTMYKDNSFVKNLFGYTEGNSEDEKARKSRIFLQDAFFFENEKRKNFYDIDKIKDSNKNEAIKEFVSSRSITPIDHFSSKAVAPLKFEYTTEDFRTEIFLNNMSDFKELQGIYFIIRDSINGEIRIGNSKTRGFGQIEFEVSDLRYSVFYGKEENFKKFEQFFEIDEEKSTKIADKYLEKVMKLKTEYKKVDIKDPNEFIKALFSEVK